jgi:hypothetical protein
MKLESFSIKDTKKIIPKMSKILLKAPVKPAEILNLFLPRSFSFFDLTLLDSSNKIFAELFNN